MSFSFLGRRLVTAAVGSTKNASFSPTRRGVNKLVAKKRIKESPVQDDPLEDTKRLMNAYVDEQLKNREILLAPYIYTRTLSTGSVVPKIIDSINYWMKVPEEKFGPIKEAIYLVYDAVTMLDDVIDDANLRRDHPTCLRIYGPERTWLATFSAVLLAIEKLMSLGQPKAVSALCHNFILQFAAITQCENIKAYAGYPTIDEYFKIAFGKNGGVYNLFFDIMQAHSECEMDFALLNALLSIYTQVQNDNMNFARGEIINGKIYAEDITTGTFNFPLLLATDKNNFDADAVFNIVRQKTKEPFIKDYCIELVHKLGAMRESKELELAFYDEIMKEIERLGGNPILVEALEKLHSHGLNQSFLPDISAEKPPKSSS